MSKSSIICLLQTEQVVKQVVSSVCVNVNKILPLYNGLTQARKSTLKRWSPESSVRCGGHVVTVLKRITIICVYLHMFISLLSASLKMQN